MQNNPRYLITYTGDGVVALGRTGRFQNGTTAAVDAAEAEAARALGHFTVRPLDQPAGRAEPSAPTSDVSDPGAAVEAAASESTHDAGEDAEPQRARRGRSRRGEASRAAESSEEEAARAAASTEEGSPAETQEAPAAETPAEPAPLN